VLIGLLLLLMQLTGFENTFSQLSFDYLLASPAIYFIAMLFAFVSYFRSNTKKRSIRALLINGILLALELCLLLLIVHSA